MNTGIRRFILRLAVGLLAFFIGIGVAWAISGLNPFQSSSGTHSYRKRCGSHRSWSASPSGGYYVTIPETTHVYEERSTKTKRIMVDIPPPPPPPAPVAPATSGGS